MKLLKHLEIVRYALVLLFLIPSLQLLAQSNIREGYVITLQGDTLYGDIDFRTPAMNMRRCVFRQKGSFTISQSLLKLMSIESMMPSNHLILCCPLLLLPSIFPNIRVFHRVSCSHQVAKVLELQLQD